MAYYIDDFSLFGIISMLHFEKNRQIYEKEKPKILVQSTFWINFFMVLTTYQNTKTWVSGNITKSAITINLMHFFLYSIRFICFVKNILIIFFSSSLQTNSNQKKPSKKKFKVAKNPHSFFLFFTTEKTYNNLVKCLDGAGA